MKTDKNILDACCGGRMMWFQKHHPDVLFADVRDFGPEFMNGRKIEVRPDVVADFRDMPFDDDSFQLVVMDPPHLDNISESSKLAKSYGILSMDWRTHIREGFREAFRVLKPGGILIFKWSEIQIKLSDVLPLAGRDPLFGNRSGKNGNTIWLAYMKPIKSE